MWKHLIPGSFSSPTQPGYEASYVPAEHSPMSYHYNDIVAVKTINMGVAHPYEDAFLWLFSAWYICHFRIPYPYIIPHGQAM